MNKSKKKDLYSLLTIKIVHEKVTNTSKLRVDIQSLNEEYISVTVLCKNKRFVDI